MRTDRTDLFARAACKARERRPCLSEVRPAAASIGRVPVDSACPCLLVLSRAARKESSASTPPDSTSETLRPRHGAAQAPRYERFSETLTGTASSRANTLPPTSPAATWHGTGGVGAPWSAAWPSRSSQRGDGSTSRTPIPPAT